MLWHLLALIVACTWGCTFVASKVLLNAGLTPAQIMLMRFALAWIMMIPFAMRRKPKRHEQMSRQRIIDELLFVILGLMGGSLYFLAENTAVEMTSATSTVALILGTTPIITAFMNRFLHRSEHLSQQFLIGSAIALAGVALVVFNGVFVLDDDPLVMLLSFAATASWGVYSLVIRHVERRYSSLVITRKVFFWGVVTMLPVCIYEGPIEIGLLFQTRVWITLLFLSIIASLGCFLLWNITIRHIGIIEASNYLYFNPVTSLVAAYLVLNERITSLAIIGCGLTIIGVYFCNKKTFKYKVKKQA